MLVDRIREAPRSDSRKLRARLDRPRCQLLGAVAAVPLCLSAAAGVAQALGATKTYPGLGSVVFWRKQEMFVLAPDANVEMRTTLLLPRGQGPFPLVVINHGSTEDGELRTEDPESTFEVASSWFLQRGYAVALPQRPGHGATGGPYLESAGSCDDARYVEAGYGAAASIKAAVTYFLHQPFVKKRVLLVGHSAGAWGALALAGQDTGLIEGVVNFSGGRGGRSFGIANRNCAPDRLVAAAATYGRTTRVPTLWLYAQNDTFFDPDLSRRMADAFRSAGGPADYHLLPPVGAEGHYLIYSPDAVRDWGSIAERFLTSLRSSATSVREFVTRRAARQ